MLLWASSPVCRHLYEVHLYVLIFGYKMIGTHSCQCCFCKSSNDIHSICSALDIITRGRDSEGQYTVFFILWKLCEWVDGCRCTTMQRSVKHKAAAAGGSQRLQQAQQIPQMRHMVDHMAGITMETDSYLACSMKKWLVKTEKAPEQRRHRYKDQLTYDFCSEGWGCWMMLANGWPGCFHSHGFLDGLHRRFHHSSRLRRCFSRALANGLGLPLFLVTFPRHVWLLHFSRHRALEPSPQKSFVTKGTVLHITSCSSLRPLLTTPVMPNGSKFSRIPSDCLIHVM